MTENNGVIILPIENILLKKEKLFLFHSEEQDIKYFLETDGTVNHIRTWVDKKPYDRDNFLEGCNHTIKRYEFEVEDAEIIILEKKYQEKTIKNLYKAINHHLYQVSINEKENIMVKRIGAYYGN